MKKASILLLFLAIVGNTLAQTEESQERDAIFLKLELFKQAFAIQRGYVLEPELAWQHDRLNFNFTYGYSQYKRSSLYKELDYLNKGNYYQLGLLYQIVASKQYFGQGLFVGVQMSYADFKETGSVTFDGPYFGDYTSNLEQSNELYSLVYMLSFKKMLSDHLILDLTGRICTVLDDYNQPHFPVYIVPGSGVTNIFERPEENSFMTGGLSVKLGYKF
ncbi:hypothetical protein LVD15_06045 [Fulvivirga maritima]|uniref:hypothetical protein n=1 Tax=Fulvivirga maritima TaxID=2904247 RepID=UPI001F16B825|nr:hypothetical protein [Fulvivirga maritima]UII27982.1 hypothetical protein LVD15_06045 [Fulvivirga maritima]